MKRVVLLATLGVAVLGLAGAALGAEERVLTKVGTVKKVDADASQIVVMVMREMTFTVTEATKIVQGEEAKKLADIKVDAKVSVEYIRGEADTRTAKKITILPAGEAGAAPVVDQPKEAFQTKTGTVTKVDAAANQVVVMVTRELTFTVTEATKIVQGDEAKKITDIKVDAKVSVDYTRVGDTRTAKKITIFPAEQ